MTDYLRRILNARVYEVADETPLVVADRLSARLGNTVLLKREDTQPTHSFKLRGAYNAMANLSPAELARGVVCSSAGNHAQGVAMAAAKLDTTAHVVMPVTTPTLKSDAVAALGGRVILHGESYADAQTHATSLQRRHGYVFIHPFDDPDVIAGQGTIGMEILRQHQRPIHAIFVAVGGGGLIAGVAAYVKAVRPETRVIGVQMDNSDAMLRSKRAGKRVSLDDVGLFADGTAVKSVGRETFRLVDQWVDDFVCVDTDVVCAAIRDAFDDTRSILEPSGAMSIAGLKRYAHRHAIKGQTLVAITCGANMNFDRLRFVAERSAAGDHRETLLAVTLAEQRGSFRALCKNIGDRNVTEFSYRRAAPDRAHVLVGLTIDDPAEVAAVTDSLENAGFGAVTLDENDLAKEHLRYMVGGRSPDDESESLFRFEFPERPGALMRFLDRLNPAWNISLFHYRNHGDDFGRILVGIQVPTADRAALGNFVAQLGYQFTDETENPAYTMFLR